MKTVFIDGSAGTTGLQIHQRLEQRPDLELLLLPEEQRKDPAARREALNRCDIAFLCLPDAAAREAVAMVENDATVVIDASTAHRTAPGWAYGLPELGQEYAAAIAASRRIAVPGCHASGFIALTAPLVAAGLLSKRELLICHSVTGYSGGGKAMIARYEAAERSPLLDAPRQYGLGQNHKHLPEMQAVTGLDTPPIFCPIVAGFYSGMAVTVPLFASQLAGTVEDVRQVYRQLYTGPIVQYTETCGEEGFLSAAALSGLDRMEISVAGSDQRILLTARYDNLGKGASGAAVECMNLALGLPAVTGLRLG
ncbi:MAG TPA: N-acetyl-gamma-glutamyl-phosphate reductase [Candidatus Fournierella merdigallinarum]|nr:N-acetyl-gamma-glutamyl-phosphate reductase [Candidatus Fournierella merdigallinarum]